MSLATTQIAVSSDWQQVSDSDCTIQSLKKDIRYDFAVGVSQPDAAFLSDTMDTPTTFAYKEPVWLRLADKGPVGKQEIINIIK